MWTSRPTGGWSTPFPTRAVPPGGLVILRGNLAPEGAVLKVAGSRYLSHEGPARVFDSEREAFQAVSEGRIEPGDVVVIRYEGPVGGPGMQEMLSVTAAIMGPRLGRKRHAGHRRPLLRRHPRPDDRARGPGGGGGRPPCPPARWRRCDPRRGGPGAERAPLRGGSWPSAGLRGSLSRPATPGASWRSTPGWSPPPPWGPSPPR